MTHSMSVIIDNAFVPILLLFFKMCIVNIKCILFVFKIITVITVQIIIMIIILKGQL